MTRILIVTGLLSCCSLHSAHAVLLYDGTLATLPGAQGWIYATDSTSAPDPTQIASASFTTLDTTADTSDAAGYSAIFHPLAPTLDRATGYNIRFDVRVDTESHDNNDRAGFSVIALSSDSQGIELAFWADKIWAQSDSFVHAEEVMNDTTVAIHQYDLTVTGNSYELSIEGDPKLAGALRDYSVSGPILPYALGDFLFVGDNTSSAAARIELARIEVQTNLVATPEPASVSFGLIGLGLFAAMHWRGGRKQRPASLRS